MITEMNAVLKHSFSMLNEKMVTDAVVRIEQLFEAYCEYNASRDRSVSINYEKMFDVCGGKANYINFSESNLKHVKIDEAKHTHDCIEKRDTIIIKKLMANGINEIKNFDVTIDDTNNGYHGRFDVDGHVIHIYLIYAGGYNIQKLHTRTLVTIDDVKI